MTTSQERLQEKIASIPEVEPDNIDLQMIADINDDTDNSISWDTYKTERAFNGNISLRVPKDLHRSLVGMAKEQGVSLNQYCLYKLAK
ncbi:MAG: type II toxin-antitoxin system HicB family antitoxin [Defluviitaleaceae bacterium]|nr:type II toxin-antitoxin system HicB family antitoxin [Defluviitaleaceae bacterium]